LDGAIALIVTAVTVFYDLMIAVGLGVVLAVVEFIRSQVTSTVVQRRWTLAERHSLRRRTLEERDALRSRSDAVIGYELKGTLFFGTTDSLFDAILPDLKSARFVILDMSRVGQVDLTAVRMIEHMCGVMREHGGELLLASVPRSMGLVKRKGHRHERVIPYHRNVRVRAFADADHALEYAENRLLDEAGFAQHTDRRIDLRESELFRDFDEEELSLVAPLLEAVEAEAGSPLFRAGDQGDDLWLLLRGQVEILLPVSGRRKPVRLAKFGPGTVFGEVAFFEPGERTAEARAVEDCECVRLRRAALDRLAKTHPELAMKILLRLGHRLGENLRTTDLLLRQNLG
ncbi:MAG: cyclic nucleotide-binding domain-containing protein, partial [Mariprofundaceae bacterium]